MAARTLTTLEYVVEDRVATITFNRPEKHNSFTSAMCLDACEALDRSDSDDEVRAVVVTGAGRDFCVGADLGEGFSARLAPSEAVREYNEVAGTIGGVRRDGGGFLALRIAQSTKPVIAAINGAAVGVGITMTLPMDVRVFGQGTRAGFVFTRRGIVPEATSSWFLPRLVGISRAMEWVATGRLIAADEALGAGLASYLVADEQVLPKAMSIAREIAENAAPVAVAAARHLMWGMLSAPTPWTAHELESRLLLDLSASPDAGEGIRAFKERDSPRFSAKVTEEFPDYLPLWASRRDGGDPRSG